MAWFGASLSGKMSECQALKRLGINRSQITVGNMDTSAYESKFFWFAGFPNPWSASSGSLVMGECISVMSAPSLCRQMKMQCPSSFLLDILSRNYIHFCQMKEVLSLIFFPCLGHSCSWNYSGCDIYGLFM